MKNKAVILIVLAGILWGTSGLFVNKLAPMDVSTSQMICLRATVAAICMSLYFFVFDRKLFNISLKHLLFAIPSGFAMYGCGAAYYASIQASSVSTAVILMYTAPVFVMAYSVAFLGEKLTKLKLFSVVIIMVGCVLVSGITDSVTFNVTGVVFGLLAGISYSAYNVLTKIQMKKGFDAATSTMYCFVFMAVFSIMFCDFPGIFNFYTSYGNLFLILAVGIGFVTSVLPYFFYTISLKHLQVGTASALGIVEPMAATIFSVLFLSEKLSIASGVGIVLIIASVLMLSTSKE